MRFFLKKHIKNKNGRYMNGLMNGSQKKSLSNFLVPFPGQIVFRLRHIFRGCGGGDFDCLVLKRQHNVMVESHIHFQPLWYRVWTPGLSWSRETLAVAYIYCQMVFSAECWPTCMLCFCSLCSLYGVSEVTFSPPMNWSLFQDQCFGRCFSLI